MTETQMSELLRRAFRDLQPSPDLVDHAIAIGRRRRRRARERAIATGLVAAGLAVGGAVATTPLFDSSAQRTVVADQGLPLPTAPDAPQQVIGEVDLAAVLASLLEGKGEVTDVRNFFPTGERPVEGLATLPDGSNGRGGEVLLDGSAVQVLVTRREGPECGQVAVQDRSNCHRVPGGFLQTDDRLTERDTGAIGRYAAYYSGELIVLVSDVGGVLDDATLSALAQKPAFQNLWDRDSAAIAEPETLADLGQRGRRAPLADLPTDEGEP